MLHCPLLGEKQYTAFKQIPLQLRIKSYLHLFSTIYEHPLSTSKCHNLSLHLPFFSPNLLSEWSTQSNSAANPSNVRISIRCQETAHPPLRQPNVNLIVFLLVPSQDKMLNPGRGASIVSLKCYSTLLLRQSHPPCQRSCLSELLG